MDATCDAWLIVGGEKETWCLIDWQVEGGGGARRPARISIRPLARKDIFYSGSIQALQASVTHTANQKSPNSDQSIIRYL